MSLSAEELLKTKSVPELRDLVISLEKDAKLKQVELQQLVGSKYHDFVESADTIKKMFVVSSEVEECVPNIWDKKIRPLIDQVAELNTKYNSSFTNSKSDENLSSLGDFKAFPFNSTAVWCNLESKNVFQATKVSRRSLLSALW